MSAEQSLADLDLNRFYRIYNNVHIMLGDRGYEPLEPQLKKREWISRYLGQLAELLDEGAETGIFDIIDQMVLLFKKNNKKLLVYFHPLDSKLCQSDMNYIHNLMKKKKTQHLIIIVNTKATPKVSNVLDILGHDVQIFNEDELVFNVTKHQLVPKHTLLTGDEREAVLKAFATVDGKVQLDLFPAIFTNDAVAKYYNFKVDDLVQIERPRQDGFTDLTYRVVTTPITDKDKKN